RSQWSRPVPRSGRGIAGGAVRAGPHTTDAPTQSRGGSPMVQAYILIQTEVGRAAQVASAISTVEGVTQVDDVTGPYDVIVRAQAEDIDALGRLVIARIQRLDGITRTLTCPVVNVES